MKTRGIIFSVLLSGMSAVLGVLVFLCFYTPIQHNSTLPESATMPVRFVSQSPTASSMVDLTGAAEKSVHAVVHVMVKVKAQDGYGRFNDPLLDFFFGPQKVSPPDDNPQVVGVGSGVIIGSDGYIVTNNHVVQGADELEITLNDKRSFKGKLIGTDPSSDIALVKIDANDLPTLSYGNSDDLKVGEWVLAVGNPFNLTSTVTAGIVSAKSRSINVIANNSQMMGIESFIQTDAAVNPGNSGGALVNINGELVGVNTAIASKTGSYTGYSFAIPSSIVQKVVSDLKEYGQVQRALLGVQIKDITSELAHELNITKLEGVYVDGVVENGAGDQAGIVKGDIILKIDDELVNSSPQLQEQIGKHRPGDKIVVVVKRNGSLKQITVLLRNIGGTATIVHADDLNAILGANFQVVSEEEKKRLKISNGVYVSSIWHGKLESNGVKDGFIIVKANRVLIESVDDLKKVVNAGEGGLFLSGLYPSGKIVYYAIDLAE